MGKGYKEIATLSPTMVFEYCILTWISTFSMASIKKQIMASPFQKKTSTNDFKFNDVCVPN
jgi:hypothetical protein